MRVMGDRGERPQSKEAQAKGRRDSREASVPAALRPVVVALSMFSRIPMPTVSWDAGALRYAIAALPLVGAIQGFAVLTWCHFATLLSFPQALTAGALLALPFLISGGLFVDGLADTSDALASHAERERRLEIMADPACGSFAVLTIVCYVVLTYALLASVTWDLWMTLGLALTYVASRALAGWTVVRWPSAHPGGLGDTFGAGARGGKAHVVLAATAVVACVGIVISCEIPGQVSVLVGLGCLAWYHRMSQKAFGGVTGDTCGWFVLTCELVMLAGLVVTKAVLG
ncbi:MAG: adenosylcobinamide-GDP ribazoletransferase [Coriobacteriia bacterium]|nr:adenosylcobinamide-GDP ribazoletransferase [Coriobacteriia bacterium]